MTDKAVRNTVLSTTAVVCLLVFILNRKLLPVPDAIPSFVFSLPKLNAFLNGTCSVLLIFSLLAIKNRNISLHKKLNLTALVLSIVFLLSYVTAHYFIPDTIYGDLDHSGLLDEAERAAVAGVRSLYLFVLLTHILTAITALPMVLLSFYYGLADLREKHKKLTRFSYPIWLYTTVTGVVVYVMIAPYYR